MKQNTILSTTKVKKANGFKNKLFKFAITIVALISIGSGTAYEITHASSKNPDKQTYKAFSNQKILSPADKESHYINDLNVAIKKDEDAKKAEEAKHQQDLKNQANQAKIEQEKQAEEKAATAAANSQSAVAASNSSQNQGNASSAATQTSATPSSTVPTTVADTSGFNFGGYHFPIAGFAGTGQVPADNYVYQWASDSRWFLIEQGGNAGHVIKANVGMGSAVTVNGRTYHVTDMVHGISNSGAAYYYYADHIGQHAIGFQTCDSVGVLTLWFAD